MPYHRCTIRAIRYVRYRTNDRGLYDIYMGYLSQLTTGREGGREGGPLGWAALIWLLQDRSLGWARWGEVPRGCIGTAPTCVEELDELFVMRQQLGSSVPSVLLPRQTRHAVACPCE